VSGRPLEALLLAGGKGERLGAASGGRPKALVPVAGRPLAAYQVVRLVEAGVERVVVSCAAGTDELFAEELAGFGAEIVPVAEAEPLGRGGGFRLAAAQLAGGGPVYALNADDLLDVDLGRLAEHHADRSAAATIAVAPLPTGFGVVELGADDAVTGFDEAPRLPHWVNAGVYVFGDEALERLPERGDQETTTFPELAAAGRLYAFRHEGVWLTVNTPKDLRRAEDYVREHPDWLVPGARFAPKD
jgi:NDP-sugar pyrophosphorylase family protein